MEISVIKAVTPCLGVAVRVGLADFDGVMAALPAGRIAISFAFNVVREISGSPYLAVDLTYEEYVAARREFEAGALRRVLGLAFSCLADPATATEALALVAQVLSWNFGLVEENEMLRPSESWRDVVLDPRLPSSLFQVAESLLLPASASPAVEEHLLTALVSLAGLSGPVFASDAERVAFLGHYVPGLARLLAAEAARVASKPTPGALGGSVARTLGLSQVCLRLCTAFSLDLQRAAAGHVQLVEAMIALARAVLAVGALERDDDGPLADVSSTLLGSFALLLGVRTGQPPPDDYRPVAEVLTDAFVDSRLAKALRTLNDDEEETDFGEDERGGAAGAGNEEIVAAACVARVAAPAVAAKLAARLATVLGSLEAAAASYAKQAGGPRQVLHAALEEADWLLRFSGHLLADDPGEGAETPMIPRPVLSSLARGGPEAEAVGSLASACFRAVSAQAACEASGCDDLASPALAGTLGWLLSRFSAVYLFPDQALYAPLFAEHELELELELEQQGSNHDKPPLALPPGLMAFSSEATVATVLGAAARGVRTWAHDPTASLAWARVFQISRRKHLRPALAAHPLWAEALAIVGATVVGASLPLQPEASRVLTCALVRPVSDKGAAVSPLAAALVSSLDAAARSASADDELVVARVSGLLQVVRGLALALSEENLGYLPALLASLIEPVARVMARFAARGPVVALSLRALRDCVAETVQMAPAAAAERMIVGSANLFTGYASLGRGSTAVRAERAKELKVLLQLLGACCSRGSGVFARGSGSKDSGLVVGIVLVGARTIFPLITPDLLALPALSRVFFRLAATLLRDFPVELSGASGGQGAPDVLRAIDAALLFGSASEDPEVVLTCLEASYVLATNHLKLGPVEGVTSPESFSRHLAQLLTRLVQRKITRDLMDAASDLLLALVCVNQSGWQAVVQAVVSSLHDDSARARVTAAATTLFQHSGVALSLDRENRRKFRTACHAFANNSATAQY
jgi:hypothetical protein